MEQTVDVTIPVEADAAALLERPGMREHMGALLSRLVTGKAGSIWDTLDRLRREAEARGLTDEILEEELAAYNAERRTAVD